MPSLLDKIWDKHVVDRCPGQPDLLYIDRHLIHEVTSPQAFEGLLQKDRRLRRPDLTIGVMDHCVPTTDRNRPLADPVAEAQLSALENNAQRFGFTLFGLEDKRQGIVHVTLPEQGYILPGLTVVCGDSHTSTHGAFGALAFGIGSSEIEHVLATQTLRQDKPKLATVEFVGSKKEPVSAKDMILAVLAQIGVSGGVGLALEYRGQVLKTLSMSERLTICNMTIECGAKIGLMAPNQIVFDYFKGRSMVPPECGHPESESLWLSLKSDEDTVFSKTFRLDLDSLSPMVTWGTNPAQTVPVDGRIPPVDSLADPGQRQAAQRSLEYQNLRPGTKLSEVAVDYVFIGSCTNSRLEDLKVAAAILKGRKISNKVTMIVSPGSKSVKKEAEKEGIDRIFKEAGAQWREPGCSMCLGMNPDVLPSGKRSASTSNRNFENRQGRGGRTHLVSPATAAASALAGFFEDPRNYEIAPL